MLRILLLLFPLCFVSFCMGQEEGDIPLSSEPAYIPGRSLQTSWLVDSAKDALSEGLPALSASLYERLLGLGRGTKEDLDSWRLLCAASHVASLDFDQALYYVDELDNRNRPQAQLLRAICFLEKGDFESAHQLSLSLEETAFEDLFKSWFFLLRAFDEEQNGNLKKAGVYFERASVSATNHSQRSINEILIQRLDLMQRSPKEEDISALHSKMQELRGERGYFEASRLLVIALVQSDRRPEALALIQDQLGALGLEEASLRGQFNMLAGLLYGVDSIEGRVAYREVLSDSQASESMRRLVLQLLTDQALEGRGRESLLGMLEVMLEGDISATFRAEMLLSRARVNLTRQEFAACEADALRLLERYPEFQFRESVIRILAYIAWRHDPPKYRTTAAYLNDLRVYAEDETERSNLALFVGDCYFLNKDFSSASDAYLLALRSGKLEDAGATLFQLVLCEVNEERLGQAAEYLNEFSTSLGGSEFLWRSEWTLISAFRKAGRLKDAFTRLSLHLESDHVGSFPLELSLRLNWLRLLLSVQTLKVEDAVSRADDLLRLLDSEEASAVKDELRSALKAHTLLLKGEALCTSQRLDQGIEVFDLLREKFKGSEAAALSYLTQSGYQASANLLVDAQRSLIVLTEAYPDSVYAPYAFWEAAVNAERRGFGKSYREAISLLEKLATTYPDHALYFEARLKQGDLSRKLNDFGSAQVIYESILNSLPDHPQRPRAELGFADSLLAQAGNNPLSRDDAAAMYERLFGNVSADVDLRLEAGFKWAYALFQSDESLRAEEAYWLVVSRFTDQDTVQQLGVRGRYWLSRSIIELGDILEKKKEYTAVQRLYHFVQEFSLPGQEMIADRLDRLKI